MKSFKKLLRGRTRNERGATFVLTAMSMVLLLWAGATGVDVGFTVYGSRQAQSMADTAAIDLARYISYADTLSSLPQVQTYLNGKLANVLADNGSNAQLTVVPGYYANGKFTADGYTGKSCKPVLLPPPGVPGCNAIEVTANQPVPQIFFGGFNLLSGHSSGNGGNGTTGNVPSAPTIALYEPEAAFSIGSYLASFNSQQSPVLNAILGPLGTNVNITAVGYQGLASSYVTLAQLINANTNVLSPTNIMTAQLSAGQWLTAYANAVASAYGTGSAAYATLQGLSFSSSASTDVPLCDIVNVNTPGTQFNCTNSSISPQGLDASLNVLQMLTTEAELADGSNAINITSALALPNIPLVGNFGTVTLSLQVIQPIQVAYGPIGTTASTAQVTATLNVNMLSLLGISIGTLSIPLSAASGSVNLQTISCTNNSLTSAELSGTTNALSAAVTLNGLQVASLNVSGVTSGNGTATFTPSQVPPPATGNPYSIGTTTPTLTFSGQAGLGLTNVFVNGQLSPTSVLSEAIGPVLDSLGVQIAGAQLAYLYTNCDAVQLAT